MDNRSSLVFLPFKDIYWLIVVGIKHSIIFENAIVDLGMTGSKKKVSMENYEIQLW